MPVVTFAYDDLLSLLGHEVSLETLLERVPQVGADVHSYDESSRELSIEFFPDRPDLYSVEGTARALRAFLGFESGLTTYEVRESDVELILDESIRSVRPFMVAGVIEDITITDELIRSLMELQEKLHLTMGRKRSKVSIGIHDMDKVTPPFTYKAVDPGSVSFVPLGKTESMDLREILERHEKGVDYAFILEGKERYPLLVDSRGEVLSFPPIINGTLTTVTTATRNVFIDVTGTDINAIKGALNIVATAMAERGGKIRTVKVRGTQNEDTPDLSPREWDISIARTNSLLGTALDGARMAAALGRMGFDAEQDGDRLRVLAPAWRMDLIHQMDIVEDVAKGHGYERFGKKLPSRQTFGSELLSSKAADVARQLMVGYGYLEVTTLTLSSEAYQFDKLCRPRGDVVEILNPISEDHTCLRVSLLPSLLTVLRRNKHRDLPQRLFEVGDVMEGMKRRRHLAAVSISARASFTEVKSLVESIMRDLSVMCAVRASPSGTFISGRGAEIVMDEKVIGTFGEVHPEVITAFELGYPIVAFELDLEAVTAGKLERVA